MGSKLVERIFFRNQGLVGLVISRPALFLKRHIRLVSASVVFAIGLMMVSAFSVALIPAPRHIAYVESFPLHLSIELERQEFSVGENITIRMVLKNVGNRTLQITYPSTGGRSKMDRVFGLYAQFNETRIYIWTPVERPAECTFSLNPDEEVSATILWDQKTTLADSYQVPPGTYSLIATIPPGGRNHPQYEIDGASVLDAIETPPLTITINSE